MADATLHMGYIGSVAIDGTSYFMSGSSLNPTQTVEAPDLVAGSIMRRGWVYGKVSPAGNISGPLHTGSDDLWPTAFDRTSDYDHLLHDDIAVEIHFYKQGGWLFSKCVIGKLDISATAGEVVNFTADFAGQDVVADASGDATAVTCSKLVTWDRVQFGTNISSGLDYLQSVNLSLNNNVQPLYAIQGTSVDDNDLYPVDLPCGVREITGSISAYAQKSIGLFTSGDNIGADRWIDYTATNAAKTITFAVAGDSGSILNVEFQAIFSRPEGTGQTGPAIYTLNFTAVCEPSGETA